MFWERNPKPRATMLPDVPELQLLFARLNGEHFGGAIPAHRIAYNGRFSNLAGRITYKPPLIELSRKHLERVPEALRDTLLHEMIHAWLYALGENPGHTAAFKKKMRELGLRSIYHDLGTTRPPRTIAYTFLLRCERCAMEVGRLKRPRRAVSCARCGGIRYNEWFRLRVIALNRPRAAANRSA